MLGGPDRRTLFVCEAPHPNEAAQARKGRIEFVRVQCLELAPVKEIRSRLERKKCWH